MPRKTLQQKFMDKFNESKLTDVKQYALSLINYWKNNDEPHDKEMNDVVKYAYTFYKREHKIHLNKMKNDNKKYKTDSKIEYNELKIEYNENLKDANENIKRIKLLLSNLRQLKFVPRYIKTDYDILGVSKKASLQSIKAAYKKKALILHPDKGGNQEEFKKLSNAYQNILKSFTRD
jgi:hypothetical protein